MADLEPTWFLVFTYVQLSQVEVETWPKSDHAMQRDQSQCCPIIHIYVAA